MDPLGKPIGQQTHSAADGFDRGHTGEDGAGIGVSGGVHSNAHQRSGGSEVTGSGFNAGLGGEHASGGIPAGHPIADKFMGTGTLSSGQTGSRGISGDAVSGSYAGGGATNALTGESHATRTGAGVGPLGENLGQGTAHPSQHHGHTHQTGAALTGTAAGAAAASGLGSGLTGSHAHSGHTGHPAESFGTGVGAVGGAGGHYHNDPIDNSESTRISGGHKDHHHGTHGAAPGAGAAAAAGGLGAGAGAAALSSGHTSHGSHQAASDVGSTGAPGAGAAGAGLYEAQRAGARGTHGDSGVTGKDVATAGSGLNKTGAGAAAAGLGAGAAAGSQSRTAATAENDRGAPLSDPKELDTGGRHGLVYQESTGKYVHRHELEEANR